MADDTTTEAPVETGGQVIQGVAVDDQGQAIPQPATTEPAEAEQPTDESAEPAGQPDEPEQEPEATEPSDEEQLTKFAETKGLKLDSDNAKKAAKMAMEAEKRMHQATKRSSELEKAASVTDNEIDPNATPEQRDYTKSRNLELRMDISDWKRTNPDKLDAESDMVKVLSDPVKKAMVHEGYLSLDDVYAIAKAGNTDAVKSQGKREALQNLAHKQQAAVPRGNAVNPSGMGAESITPQNVDRLVGQHDLAWFEKNRDAINQAMAG